MQVDFIKMYDTMFENRLAKAPFSERGGGFTVPKDFFLINRTSETVLLLQEQYVA